jgi:hypothetical protein
MNRLLGAFGLLFALIAGGAYAQAPTGLTFPNGLTGAGAIADTDTFLVCQSASGCDGTAGKILLTGTGTQLNTYLSGKVFPITIGSTSIAALSTTTTIAGLTLTAPVINAGTFSGTFAGNHTISGIPTFSNVPVFSGLSALTQTKCLGLDASNNLAYVVGACGTSGGTGFPITIGSTSIGSGSTTTTIAGLTLTTPTINGATLSGTFAGNATYSGVTITYTGLGSGTCALALWLDSSNTLKTGACGGGGGSGTVVASPQFQLPYYASAGTTASVAGNSAMTVTAAGSMTINRTGLALPPALSGGVPVLWGVGIANEIPTLLLDAFGTTSDPALTFRSARGTSAAPTAIQSGDVIGHVGFRGYGATGYPAAGTGRVQAVATQNFTDAAMGTELRFLATANGSISPATSAVIGATGLTVGTPSAQSSPTAGDIDAVRIFVNGVAVSTTVGTVTSATLSSPGGIFAATGTNPITTSGTFGYSTTGTSGGVPYFSSGSVLTSSAALGQYSVVLGGGAAAAPHSLTPGATAGFVLTSNGSSADPSWQASAGTGLSGMTATQIPVAATATTVTSSVPVATTNTANAVVKTGSGGFVDASFLPGTVTPAATTHTIDATTEWAPGTTLSVTTASQTFTLPAMSTVTQSGSIVIQTPTGLQTTLTANAADGINGGSTGGSVVIPADSLAMVVKSGASGTGAVSVNLGPLQYFALAWAEGVNLSTNARYVGRVGSTRHVYGIKCNVQAAGGSASTVHLYSTASGTAPASGTLLDSTGCNANAASNTEQDMGVAGADILAGYTIWAVFSGSGTSGNGGLNLTFR